MSGRSAPNASPGREGRGSASDAAQRPPRPPSLSPDIELLELRLVRDRNGEPLAVVTLPERPAVGLSAADCRWWALQLSDAARQLEGMARAGDPVTARLSDESSRTEAMTKTENTDPATSTGAAAARIADDLGARFVHRPGDGLLLDGPPSWAERGEDGTLRTVSEHLVKREVLRRLRALRPRHDAKELDEVLGLVGVALYDEADGA